MKVEILKTKKLTYEQAVTMFRYNEETGILTNAVDRGIGGRFKKGTEAGFLNKTNGYRRVSVPVIGYKNGKHYQSTHVIWLMKTGKLPEEGMEIDHIDGIRINNKWSNLRTVTNQDNARNKCISKKNTSGVIGVRWSSYHKKWRADIGSRQTGTFEFGGYFHQFDQAVIKRKELEVKHNYHKNHGRKVV